MNMIRYLPEVLSPLSNAISSRISAFTLLADDNSKWSFGNSERRLSIDLQMCSRAMWKLPLEYSKTYKAYDRSSSAVATAKFLLPCIERLMSNARYCNEMLTFFIKYLFDFSLAETPSFWGTIEKHVKKTTYRISMNTSYNIIDIQ